MRRPLDLFIVLAAGPLAVLTGYGSVVFLDWVMGV